MSRFPRLSPTPDASDQRPPGRMLRVRCHRDLRTLLPRIEDGDLVVVDARDLDAETARSLAERNPYAVLNAAEFISGRFANLGPRVLGESGVVLLEGQRDLVLGLRDGATLRLDGETLYDGVVVALDVRLVTADEVAVRMDRARSGLAAQLDSFAHTASEFLRREEPAVLHGIGLPELRTRIAGRPVVVVGPSAVPADLKRLRGFLREQKPVLIGVDGGAATLVRRRLRPDLVVLSGAGTCEPKVLTRCAEVVLTGSGEAVRRQLEKLDLPVHTVHNGVAGTDLALLLGHRAGARLLVPVGTPATLEDFIDRGRSDQASQVITRLKVGSVLVEAAALPQVYTGRVRPWHLAGVLLAAVAVLAVAVALTPIGNAWWHDVHDSLPFGSPR